MTDFSKMTMVEIKKKLKSAGVKGYSKMKKTDLVNFAKSKLGKEPIIDKKKIIKRKKKLNLETVKEKTVIDEGLYDIDRFMTDSEANARTEKAQLKAFENAFVRQNKLIDKRLMEIAKENNIKTTEEMIKFLPKSDKAMRRLLDI